MRLSQPNDPEAMRGRPGQGGASPALPPPASSDLECVYAYACGLFGAGDYTGAKRYYRLLTRLAHGQFNYWLALGLTCQRRSEHDEAIVCFGRAGAVRRDDPRPAYHAGLSYRQAGLADRARTAFSAALKGCGEKPEYAAFKAEVARQAQF